VNLIWLTKLRLIAARLTGSLHGLRTFAGLAQNWLMVEFPRVGYPDTPDKSRYTASRPELVHAPLMRFDTGWKLGASCDSVVDPSQHDHWQVEGKPNELRSCSNGTGPLPPYGGGMRLRLRLPFGLRPGPGATIA